jgi:chromate transporter
MSTDALLPGLSFGVTLGLPLPLQLHLPLQLGWVEWLGLLGHFVSLSLLAVGGAITTVPEMHRYLVDEQHWLADTQFTACVAIAQASPGPNVLFVGLMGWSVGMNAGGWPLACLGLGLAMLGILIPSTTLTYFVAQWGHKNRERLAVRAFKQGMAPIVVALLVATGWVLCLNNAQQASDWPLWLLSAGAALLVWRSNLHLLWLLGAGAALGAVGWV